ncbi:uncharacterized protein LOC112568732 isoform X2 [Pomacea canaliculata]|uniref:uncharacterized protein LOC112568732 isoform X2 n=1 Tax=Pomacea canaliculata TaxID=400727 RepID=UPI000D7328AC|nr:uncharacterized protein LOC112568732 isoform X2 [Pomacea canaliculata]
MAVWSLWILCSLALLSVKGDSAMYIRDCSDEKRTIIEETKVTLICGQYQTRVEWSWSYSNWPRNTIGYCNVTGCGIYIGLKLPITLSKLTTSVSGIFESRLDISDVTRQQNYSYHCRNTDSGKTATCGLRVIAPAIIVGDNCDVRVSEWQIYGSCAVERMYASDGVYTCIWREDNTKIHERFQDTITYYVLDSRIYGRGVCSFSQNMPVDQGSYTYSMDIDPGSQNIFYKTINIVPPGEPSHDCPETVFVGSNVSCKCTSSNPGTPPAEFAWDGSGTDTLFLQDIRPENTTINYSCRLIWGPNGYINRTIVYTLRIAENEREKNAKGGIIGGCVAAVFILAIIGIVIAVYIVKRRKAPLYDTARRPANNEHSYDDLTQKSGDTPHSPGTLEIRDGMITKDEHRYEEVILESPSATQPTVAIFAVPRTSQTVSSP